MRVNCAFLDFEFATPMAEPQWSDKLPRWYQLDGAAFALTELLVQNPMDFDYLIVASPQASNLTDWEFAQSGASRAQKFVHTLPNIRASMALQALGKISPFTCLQKGEETLSAALTEFNEIKQETQRPALVCVELYSQPQTAHQPQIYRATLIHCDPQGDWELSPSTTPSESSFAGHWKLEKIS